MVALLSLFIACAPTPHSVKFEGDSKVTVHTVDAMPVAKATVLDEAGKALPEQPKLDWSVEPATVAKLDGMNVVPVANGEAKVTAKVGEVSGSYTFVVALPDKVEVAGWTAGSPWPVGAETQLTAAVKAGETVLEGQKVEWSTSDAAIATVADGKVMGVAAGKATITAKLNETVAGTLEVEIGGAAVAADATTAPQ